MDSLSRVKRGARLGRTEGGESLRWRLSAEHWAWLELECPMSFSLSLGRILSTT